MESEHHTYELFFAPEVFFQFLLVVGLVLLVVLAVVRLCQEPITASPSKIKHGV